MSADPVHLVTPRPKKVVKVSVKPKLKSSKECSICRKNFSKIVALNSHLRTVHKLNIPKRCDSHFCPLCFVPQQTRKNYVQHLSTEHGQELVYEKFILDSIEEFREWKEKLEFETQSYFCCHGNDFTDLYRPYYCNRSGRFKSKVSSGVERKRSLKVQGTRKIGAMCPATIKLKIVPDKLNAEKKQYHVLFCSTHLGHEQDPNHLDFKRRPLNFVYTGKKNEGRGPLTKIPEVVVNDPIAMEHDYFSWRSLIGIKPKQKDPNEVLHSSNFNYSKVSPVLMKDNQEQNNATDNNNPLKESIRKRFRQIKTSSENNLEKDDSELESDLDDIHEDTSSEDEVDEAQAHEAKLVNDLHNTISHQVTELDQLTTELKHRYKVPQSLNINSDDLLSVVGHNQQLIDTMRNLIRMFDGEEKEKSQPEENLQQQNAQQPEQYIENVPYVIMPQFVNDYSQHQLPRIIQVSAIPTHYMQQYDNCQTLHYTSL